MLIARKIVAEATDDSISVSETANGWRLDGPRFGSPWTFEFDSTLVTDKPDVAFLVISRLGIPRLVWASELFNDRVAHAHAMSRANVSTIAPVAAFAVEGDGKAHCFVSNSETCVGGLECVIDESGKAQSDVLASHIPALADYFRKLNAKRALLGKVSTTDSLGALEAQVDMLTSVVNFLVSKLPQSEQPSVALRLADIMTKAGVTMLHSEEKLLLDLGSHKSKLRDLQRDYFAQRDGAA